MPAPPSRPQPGSDRPPCVVGIPMMNLHKRTAKVLRDIAGPDVDKILVFDHASDDPETIAWLERVEKRPKVTVDRRAIIPEESLYRAWNDTIRWGLEAFPDQPFDVVLLNNDVRVPPGFVRFLTSAMRSGDPRVMIAYPDRDADLDDGVPDRIDLTLTRGLAGDGGMTGWAFAIKGEAFRDELPFIDERLRFYSGDRDLIHNVETRGYRAARVNGLPCRHRLGVTRKRRPDLQEQQRRDVELWWSEHPGASVRGLEA